MNVSVVCHLRELEPPGYILAQPMRVPPPLTLPKQHLHGLGHIDPEKHIPPANRRRDRRQEQHLADGVLLEVLFAEGLRAQVPFDDEFTVEPAEDAQEDEEDDFEKVPVAVVGDLEHDELAGAEGVHCLGIGGGGLG